MKKALAKKPCCMVTSVYMRAGCGCAKICNSSSKYDVTSLQSFTA